MDIDPIEKLCQGQVRIDIGLPVPSLFSPVISQWEVRKQHRAEPLHGHRGSFPSGSEHCRCYCKCLSKSSYSESGCSLEDQCCLHRRSTWITDTWHVGKEQNVGPRAGCSVAVKTTGLLKQQLSPLLCPTCGGCCFFQTVF